MLWFERVATDYLCEADSCQNGDVWTECVILCACSVWFSCGIVRVQCVIWVCSCGLQTCVSLSPVRTAVCATRGTAPVAVPELATWAPPVKVTRSCTRHSSINAYSYYFTDSTWMLFGCLRQSHSVGGTSCQGDVHRLVGQMKNNAAQAKT